MHLKCPKLLRDSFREHVKKKQVKWKTIEKDKEKRLETQRA
jgi:hypothetical protein